MIRLRSGLRRATRRVVTTMAQCAVVRGLASMVLEISASHAFDEGANPLRGPAFLESHPVVGSSRPAHLVAARSSSKVSAYVVLVRRHLDSVARLMSGDQYIGRGCRQRVWRRAQSQNSRV